MVVVEEKKTTVERVALARRQSGKLDSQTETVARKRFEMVGK